MHRGTQSHYVMQSDLSVYGGILKKRLTSQYIDNNVEMYPCNLQKQREIIIIPK